MTEVMVDTSGWIHFFRHGQSELAAAVDRLLEEERVVLCGMVELELLQGVRGHERQALGDVLQALAYVETGRSDFIAAGDRLAQLRSKGVTIPASDGLIGMLCLRHDLQLLTLDAHFDHLPEVKRLRVA